MGQPYTKKPISELAADAKGGNVEAQKALGMLHELGLVPEASASEGARLYARAAKSGDPLAALYLGSMLEQGAPGLAADTQAAAAYFQMAEKAGFHKPEQRLRALGIGVRPTILLVDDSQSGRNITCRFLCKSGFEVVEAPDAAHAIRYLQTRGPVDLVLSAVEMPHMDGVEMLSVIRNGLQLKELPVVMVTSVRELSMLKKAKPLGVQGWFLKPYDQDMLIQSLKKALDP